MTAVDVPVGGFSFGRVISNTFRVIGRNLVPFLILAFIAAIPLPLFQSWLGNDAAANGQINPAAFATGAFWLRFVVIQVLSIFLTYLLQAALTYGTIVDLNGGKVSLGDAIGVGARAALPMLAIGILTGLGVGLGFLLLVFPGLMLMTAWSVVVPAYVAEKTGVFEAFGRSANLTKGHRWAIFGLLVVFLVALLIVELGARPLFGLSVMNTKIVGLPLTFLAFEVVLRMISLVVGATGAAAIYYELRTGKEGIGPQQLASVFD